MDRIWPPATDTDDPHISDSQNVRTALNLARAAFVISNIVLVTYMSVIQCLLIRVRFSKSKITHPTSTERSAVVIVLWIIHRLFEISLSVSVDAAVRVFWNEKILLHYQVLKYVPESDTYHWAALPIVWTWENNIRPIFWEVLVTWLIYLTISLSISLHPRFVEARQNPHAALARFKWRFSELVTFTRMMFQEEDPVCYYFFTSLREKTKQIGIKKIGQTIQLQRYREETPVDGPRILNWELGIDQNALAEMMETLGPPGGFGELGFNISAGKVSFGAMGVGTRFNLNFVLEPDMKEETSLGRKSGGRKKPRWRRAQSN